MRRLWFYLLAILFCTCWTLAQADEYPFLRQSEPISQNRGALPLQRRVGSGRIETALQQRQIARGLQELVAPIDPLKTALWALVQ